MQYTNVIKKPLLTEKTMELATNNQYSFEVDRRANKHQIAAAVQKEFDVTVEQVRTQVRPGKSKRVLGTRKVGRRSARKVAVATVAKGQKIPLFEEVLKEDKDAD